jgi:transketolase
MGQRVVFVMTHDSIGLGEDGPTHQPVEHLAALRAIPNLLVFRPCDAMETAECWQLALETQGSPSVLALTRQKLPAIRKQFDRENLSAHGAYVVADGGEGQSAAVVFASGSEVSIAVAACGELAKQGISIRVVSVPSFELFETQEEAYKASVMGTESVRVAVEAGVRQGWDRFIGSDGAFVGMSGFGASGPYEQLYRHFGITADAVVAAVKSRVA